MARLVCPHHLVHARPGPARFHENPCRKRGTGDLDEDMIVLTLPEIRRLLIAFILTPLHAADRIWASGVPEDGEFRRV